MKALAAARNPAAAKALSPTTGAPTCGPSPRDPVRRGPVVRPPGAGRQCTRPQPWAKLNGRGKSGRVGRSLCGTSRGRDSTTTRGPKSLISSRPGHYPQDMSTSPVVERLTPTESWRLLRQVSVGRLAVLDDGHVDIFPLNFVVDGDSVVFRTAMGTKFWGAIREESALEGDAYDRGTRSGVECGGSRQGARHSGWIGEGSRRCPAPCPLGGCSNLQDPLCPARRGGERPPLQG